MDDKTQLFLDWLDKHGAVYHKIAWPSYMTQSGMRGAVALHDINSNEYILEIPTILMMTPLNAHSDEYIGKELQASSSLLRGDLLLTIFIMYECIKHTSSFWYPYLNILPPPQPVSSWDDRMIDELQSSSYKGKIASRIVLLQNMYKRSVVELCRLYPDKFSCDTYTYELFEFAYNTISARAFGRRLPWSALVPLADCLNHTNKQTKYDYNIMYNNMFRLYPSGSNAYHVGDEVFNSYGRRNNDNLMLDYGFSMMDNMWDYDEVLVNMDMIEVIMGRGDKVRSSERLRVLLALGFASYHHLRVTWDEHPWKILPFLRVLVASDDDIDMFWNNLESSSSSSSSTSSSSYDDHTATKLLFVDPINIINEMNMYDILSKIITHHLSSYKTSIHDDEMMYENLQQQIRSSSPSSSAASSSSSSYDVYRRSSAIIYRLTKKHLHHHLLQKCHHIHDILSSSSSSYDPTSSSASSYDDACMNIKKILSSSYHHQDEDHHRDHNIIIDDDHHISSSSSSSSDRERMKMIKEHHRVDEYVDMMRKHMITKLV